MIKFTIVQKKTFVTWQFGKIGVYHSKIEVLKNCSEGNLRELRGNLKQKIQPKL